MCVVYIHQHVDKYSHFTYYNLYNALVYFIYVWMQTCGMWFFFENKSFFPFEVFRLEKGLNILHLYTRECGTTIICDSFEGKRITPFYIINPCSSYTYTRIHTIYILYSIIRMCVRSSVR